MDDTLNNAEQDAMSIIDAAMIDDDADYGEVSSSEDGQITEDAPTTIVDPNEAEDVNLMDQEPVAETVTPVTPVAADANATVDPNVPADTRQRIGNDFLDANNNIVDKDNKILARSGAEARLYTKASRATSHAEQMQRQNDNLSRQMQEAQSTIQRAQEISNLPASMGLTEPQYKEGLTLMKRMGEGDFVAVAKEVVAIALANGHNVTDIIGDQAGNAVEMGAIQRMVQDATAPMRTQHEAQTAQARQQQQVQANYNNFVAQYPLAELHQTEVAHLINKGMNPTDAYYEVREFASRNGLDFNQPLKPQAEAKERERANTPQQQQQQPMLRGGSSSTQQQHNIAGTGQNGAREESFADIIRSAMKS